MPAKKEPALTDEERAGRIRELAAEAGTSDDPAEFNRAFEKVAKGEQTALGTKLDKEPNSTGSKASATRMPFDPKSLEVGKCYRAANNHIRRITAINPPDVTHEGVWPEPGKPVTTPLNWFASEVVDETPMPRLPR